MTLYIAIWNNCCVLYFLIEEEKQNDSGFLDMLDERDGENGIETQDQAEHSHSGLPRTDPMQAPDQAETPHQVEQNGHTHSGLPWTDPMEARPRLHTRSNRTVTLTVVRR